MSIGIGPGQFLNQISLKKVETVANALSQYLTKQKITIMLYLMTEGLHETSGEVCSLPGA